MFGIVLNSLSPHHGHTAIVYSASEVKAASSRFHGINNSEVDNSFGLLPFDGAERDAKADEMDAAGRSHGKSVRGPGKLDIIVPTTTSEYFALALRRPEWVLNVLDGIIPKPI